MVTTSNPREATGGAVTAAERPAQPARLSTEQVWHALERASFAVVSYVTPAGEPRSSGVLYTVVGQRLYVAIAPDSWKARHIPASGRVAVTVPVRRGGILSLLFPIPPATVSFHAKARVHPASSPEIQSLKELEPLLPAERRDASAVPEIIPEGRFLTYGLGVSLMQMRDPAAARAHVPVR
ncbi:MAG TPA: pyridoxamine 5'-phosphate oxidase family protein [Gemmatimonadales bacterium]